ncbi:hypothetical protein [Lysinibacillus varians]|uniref:Uncharacterized protein n=1 Tax=Lysinibacillus varians TaxID=1145276 RepID=A0ABY2T9G4_9BACI|nr:hypothetical protein [Lysinibacillus varians]AHN24238.1 hypothetical protein T479_12290 [Lysinibacillus varians]TKI52654.1 hypothetical protein FC752_18895 [Lysinibacillus varians]
MTETLEKVERKITELNVLADHIKELVERQEKILIELWNQKKEIAALIKENGYKFCHPSIEYHTSRGPILAYSKKENTLYAFEIGRGLIKVNLYSNEVNGARWKEIIQNGWFEDAYQGIKYLDKMIDDYIKDNKQIIEDMQKQILSAN